MADRSVARHSKKPLTPPAIVPGAQAFDRAGEVATGPAYDPAQEALVLLGYLIENAHVVAIDAAGRAVLEVRLGPAVLDQLAAFGSQDEDLEDGDEDDAD